MVYHPEIVEGLKNAIERGYSLDLAKQSFINSGYARQEVEEAASALGYSSYPGIQSQPSPQQSSPSSPPPQSIPRQLPQQPRQPNPNFQQARQPINRQPPQQAPQAPFDQQFQPQLLMKQPFMPKEKKGKKGLIIIITLAIILTLLLLTLLTTVFWPEKISSILQSLGIDIQI
ncbi:MAG: hypothetical protein ABIH72_00800 [archaeon]